MTLGNVQLPFPCCREHTTAQGLEYVAAYSSSQVKGDDLKEAFEALKEKRQPQYAKL